MINLDVDMDTNMQNIAYLGKIMSMRNKQHLKAVLHRIISMITISLHTNVKRENSFYLLKAILH